MEHTICEKDVYTARSIPRLIINVDDKSSVKRDAW